MKVVITSDTFLKAMPTQAKQIREKNIPNQLVEVKAGTELQIVDQFPYEGNPNSEADDHVFVQLDQPIEGCQRWFIYGLHAKLEGTEANNNPKQDPPIQLVNLVANPAVDPAVKLAVDPAIKSATDPAAVKPVVTPAKAPDFGPTISLPGISRPVGIYEPVYFEPKASNFTWAELTKGGARIPVDATITQRIVKLSEYMDEVRSFLGDRPIRVTSGYRDPASNRSVGGARNSRHMYGDAVDFWVEGMDVVDVFYQLKSYHLKGGLAVGNGFVHVDLRPGAPARWTYPGGPSVSLW
jgi:hypothetical protein